MELGRRSELTTELQEQVVLAIHAGNFREVAARFAGITERTFFNWMARGCEYQKKLNKGEEVGEKEEKFFHFLHAVESAEIKAEVFATGLITKAAKRDWRAAAWYLERKHKQCWARMQQLKHEGVIGTPSTLVDFAKMRRADRSEGANATDDTFSPAPLGMRIIPGNTALALH